MWKSAIIGSMGVEAPAPEYRIPDSDFLSLLEDPIPISRKRVYTKLKHLFMRYPEGVSTAAMDKNRQFLTLYDCDDGGEVYYAKTILKNGQKSGYEFSVNVPDEISYDNPGELISRTWILSPDGPLKVQEARFIVGLEEEAKVKTMELTGEDGKVELYLLQCAMKRSVPFTLKEFDRE